MAASHQALTAEILRLDTALDKLARHAAPKEFLAKRGVAIQVTTALLATTGDNPVAAHRGELRCPAHRALRETLRPTPSPARRPTRPRSTLALHHRVTSDRGRTEIGVRVRFSGVSLQVCKG